MFKNAYFGKPYKTRDGRKAIYKGYLPSPINKLMFHYLMVDQEEENVGYLKNGHRGLWDEQP